MSLIELNQGDDADGASAMPDPIADPLGCFVDVPDEQLEEEVNRLVYGGDGEAGANNEKEIASAVSDLSLAAERPIGVHVAAERIVRLCVAHLRPYFREFEEELYTNLDPSIRGVIEERVVDVLRLLK